MRRVLAALAALALVAGAAAGCGGDPDRTRVLAAASLTGGLPGLDPTAEHVFGGSSELATQIREGAAADVFVSADPRWALELVADGLASRPTVVATNRLVVIVPRDDDRVRVPGDLESSGVRLVIAQPGVPAGDYARAALRSLGLEDALANVVSEERDVKGVVGKVALGEADAGIAYATDVAPARGRVRALPLPDGAQPTIRYLAVELRDGPRARAYLDRLTGAEGRRALAAAGFGPP